MARMLDPLGVLVSIGLVSWGSADPGDVERPDTAGVALQDQEPARQPRPEPRSLVEDRVLRALEEDDPQLRAAAISYLGWYGDDQALPSILPFFSDHDPELRAASFAAANIILRRYARTATSELRSRVLAGLDDPEYTVRRVALQSMAPLIMEPGNEDLLEPLARAVRGEAASHLYLDGMRFLAWHAADRLPADLATQLSADLATQLRTWTDPFWQQEFSGMLDLIIDPEDASAVYPLIGHEVPLVAHRAARTLARLNCCRDGDEDYILDLPEPSERRAYAAEIRSEERALYSQVSEIEEDHLLRVIDEARVILVGEIHGNHEVYVLDIRILKHLVTKVGNDNVVVGYETPVMDAQEEVLAVARELGVAAMPLEPPLPDWGSLTAVELSLSRDLSISDRINEWAAMHPKQKMLVIYGQAHVLGRNSLGRLEVPAVVVLSLGFNGLLAHMGNDPESSGRTFALGSEGRAFLRPCGSWLEQNTQGGAELFAYIRKE